MNSPLFILEPPCARGLGNDDGAGIRVQDRSTGVHEATAPDPAPQTGREGRKCSKFYLQLALRF